MELRRTTGYLVCAITRARDLYLATWRNYGRLEGSLVASSGVREDLRAGFARATEVASAIEDYTGQRLRQFWTDAKAVLNLRK